ncbi:MAG: tetratricopeptide repeat protein [Gemmatimonadetes bacterium]|nr:tetratricopeptide repeat protein [Candidatus Palauibacter australiensis]
MVRTGARAATAATVASIFTSAGLFGQECEFDANSAASTASEAIQRLAEAATAQDSLTIFTEAWEALGADLDSDNPVVPLLGAQIQMGLGNFPDAVEFLERYEATASPECMMHGEAQRYNGWVRLYNQGVTAYSASDHDAALEAFMLANDFKPDLRTYSNAALLQSQMGDNAGAIETYQAALAADIPDADAESLRNTVSGLGDMLAEEGRADEAIQTYSDYLTRYPDDVVIQIRYAGVLSDQGQTEESAAIYAETLERTDLTYQQWLEVGVGFYNAQNFPDAATAFGNARAGNPYSKEAMENYVNASIQSGRPGPVVALADTLTQWYPYDALAHQLRFQSLGRADMNDQAMEAMGVEQALPLSVTFAQMAAAANGRYIIQLAFTNRTESGTLQVAFEFVDAGGQVVTEHTQTFDADSGSFTFEIQSDVPLAGFRYGTIGG